VFALFAQQARGLGDDPKKRVDAYRIVGTPHQAYIVLLDHLTDVVQLFEPTGGSDDQVHAKRRNALDVFDHRGGHRKINRDIDAGERLWSDSLKIRVVEFIELVRDGGVVIRRELLDEFAHLSVADDR